MKHYLDYNATAPVRPNVVMAMEELHGLPLNPSSVHAMGRKAKHIVEDARRTLGEVIGAFPNEIVFTGARDVTLGFGAVLKPDGRLSFRSDAEFRDFRGAHGWEAFEQRIFVKERVLGVLEHDLRRYFRAVEAAGTAGAAATPIVIGTATDPYQPAERRFRLTRQILERLARLDDLVSCHLDK